ncbi:MAG: hypothetical protein K1W14_06570 [Muribaculaceae bacterium]|jgi:hypothetical protein
MRIFIVVPVENRKLEEARHEADLVKASLSRRGHTPVSPFDIYVGKGANKYDRAAAWMRAALDCDCVFMCVGWGNSPTCCTIFNAVRNFSGVDGNKEYRVIYGRSKDKKS